MTDITEKNTRGQASDKRRARSSAPSTESAMVSAPAAGAGYVGRAAGVWPAKAVKGQVGKMSKGKLQVRAHKGVITYASSKGVSAFVSRVARATPIELVEVERQGVASVFLKDLSKHMHISAVRMFEIVGIPKATAEKKVAAKEVISGAGGQAALGLARLLAIAEGIIENSTAEEAKGFDVARWLGQWIERPQPALGGCKPADLIGTPTGFDMVARVLGAIESGAYQ